MTEWAKRIPGYGIVPGLALDLTTRDEDGVPWDFDLPERREAARMLIAEQKPLFLIGSPMCTAFCAWQRLNATRRDPESVRREYNKAMVHLEFVCQLYRDQVSAKRYFLHEHPDSASSWQERCITALLATATVDRCVGDQCCYGQNDRRGGAVKKPTGWMSNSPEVLLALSKRCQGRAGLCSVTGEPHVPCSGKVARNAAIYPAKLCRAILEGFRRQLQCDGLMEVGVMGIDVAKMQTSMPAKQHQILDPYRVPVTSGSTAELFKEFFEYGTLSDAEEPEDRANEAKHNQNDEDSSVQSDTRLNSLIWVLEGEAFNEVCMTQDQDQKIEIALDSGAGEHVASRSAAAGYTVVESAGSRAGQHFVAAGGARIPNEGQFTLALRSGDLEKKKGKDIKSTFQVAKVTRPLWSVGRICDEGFDVKFTNNEAYVMTKEGKEVCKFKRKGGLYVAELHLKSPVKTDQSFQRQGR